ncbi:hypothetical protein ACLKA6_011636 [Drosophila palustris]
MDCRAAGLPANTSTTFSSEEQLVEEPAQLNLDKIYDQLEQMKQRAKSLRKLLVREQPMTAKYVKCLEEIEKKGSRNAEVRAVQLQTAHLVNQMATLARRFKEDSTHGNGLECYMKENRRKTDKLYSRMEKLQKWPEKVKHQTAMCLDRYQDISISCVNVDEFSPFIKRTYETFSHVARNKTPLDCYQVDHRNVARRLSGSWLMMHESFQYLLQNQYNLSLALENHRRLGHFSRSARSMPQSAISHPDWDEESTESMTDSHFPSLRASSVAP